jgi:GT2 family glycosyltransferase
LGRVTALTQSPIDISVVIPCRNGAETLGQQLDAVLGQITCATYEVVIADNGSTDGTAALVGSYAARDLRVRLVDASREPGANVARNDGVKAARGAFILMCDADDLVHPGWIDAYWRAFADGAQGVGGGINRVLETGEVLRRERKLYRSSVGVAFANTTNCGFPAAAFHRIGGFDESFSGGADEVVFFHRLTAAGYHLGLVPDAVVDKVQHTNLGDAFRQYFHFGVGEARAFQTLKPGRMTPMVAVSMVQAVLWSIAWATIAKVSSQASRNATCTFAWNLGLVSEGVRLMYAGGSGTAVQLPPRRR